jgi:hypothetical protein
MPRITNIEPQMSKCHTITPSICAALRNPISINQQDLQRRFDRWLDKTKGLVQDAADAEERAEKAESLADAAQERMSLKDRVISKLKNTITDLKADLEHHILDPDDVGKSVSFKLPGSKECDPDFELTLMEVLHLTSFRTAWPIMRLYTEGSLGARRWLTSPLAHFYRSSFDVRMCWLISKSRLRLLIPKSSP